MECADEAVKPVSEKLDQFVDSIEALCDVLEGVDLAQQYLQTKGITLDKVVTKLEALKIFLREERD